MVPRDNQWLAIELDGKPWLELDPLEADRLGLQLDLPLTAGMVADVEAAALAHRALARGAVLVGRRSHARGELETRLARRDGAEAARKAADRLVAMGVIDDARHARELTALRLRAGWGPARIAHDLTAAGVANEQIESALHDIEVAVLDAAAHYAVGARSGADAWRRLLARGFDEDVAERIIGSWFDDS